MTFQLSNCSFLAVPTPIAVRLTLKRWPRSRKYTPFVSPSSFQIQQLIITYAAHRAAILRKKALFAAEVPGAAGDVPDGAALRGQRAADRRPRRGRDGERFRSAAAAIRDIRSRGPRPGVRAPAVMAGPRASDRTHEVDAAEKTQQVIRQINQGLDAALTGFPAAASHRDGSEHKGEIGAS